MPRNKLPKLLTNYIPRGKRKPGRPQKRLLDFWVRPNGSTSGLIPMLADDSRCEKHVKKVWVMNFDVKAKSLMHTIAVYI